MQDSPRPIPPTETRSPFLGDGSAAAALLRDHDWSGSSLGDPSTWSPVLRTAVALMFDSPTPMWLAWGEALAMVYNERYVELLGNRHPASLGAPLPEVWAEIWPDLEARVTATLAGHGAQREDRPVRIRRDGHDGTAWFTFSYAPLREADGSVAGLLCTAWETTGKVNTQRRLGEALSRFEAFTAASADSTYRMNADWTEMLELHGRGALADTVASDPAWASNYILADDRPLVAKAVERAIRTRGVFELEHRVLKVDGSIGWTHSRAIPILDEGGEVLEWFGTAADVTERRLASEKLRESERLYQALFEAIDEGFCIIEFLDGPEGPMSDYVHVSANPAYLANAGIADVVGQRVREMVPAEADAWVETYREVLLTGKPIRFERELVATGRYLELSAYRVEPVERRQVAVLFLDGTQRHRAEKALRELNDSLERRVADAIAERMKVEEALRQAQKMEAVGQLTGGIAHDFNNMLAVVLGALNLIERRYITAESPGRRHVDAAKDGVKRAAQLTQRLLAFSRQQPLKPEPVDVNELVAGMSELLRHSLGSSVRLETIVAGGLWRAHADPNQLENAVLNLAINGRDAMPEGGRLTIETANCHLDDRYAAANLGVTAGQYVMVAVSDTGTGMAPETVAKAFDPFFTTKEVGRGTGLGLSQVYGFVKQSGGHVKIYSELGEGTVVKVYLPRRVGVHPADHEARGEAVAVNEAGKERVLIVEDEPSIRELSAEALTELGYDVLQAEGGKAALELIDAHSDIDLLFTDIVMPEMNGRQLADEAVRRRPGLKVLFTTGYTRNAIVHNGQLDAGVHLVGKPYSIDDLARGIRTVLDESK